MLGLCLLAVAFAFLRSARLLLMLVWAGQVGVLVWVWFVPASIGRLVLGAAKATTFGVLLGLVCACGCVALCFASANVPFWSGCGHFGF
jgi:hypothetical protein